LNTTNPFAEALKNYIPHAANQNHMTFAEQCGYYGALMSGIPNPVVAAAAGIANPTVSYLSRAGARAGGQVRYPKVAAEYQSLGHDAFVAKYVTAALRDRCLIELENYKNGLLEPRYTGTARTSRAKGYVGVHILKPRSEFATDAWRIKIVEREGQFFALILTSPISGEIPEEHAQKLGPYATDHDCYLGARSKLTPTTEELA